MAEEKVYKILDDIAKHAFIDTERYQEMYTRSIEKSDIFWEEQAEKFLTWFSKWDKVQQWDYKNVGIKEFFIPIMRFIKKTSLTTMVESPYLYSMLIGYNRD